MRLFGEGGESLRTRYGRNSQGKAWEKVQCLAKGRVLGKGQECVGWGSGGGGGRGGQMGG